MSDKNIYQRIHAVMNEIGTVEKRGRNDFHKYDYATEADFVQALRPLLEKHGLVVIPTVKGQDHKQIGEKGDYITTLVVNFRIINIDNPTEYYDAVIVGQGSDKTDKGVYKALTGAKKYFMALTFMVATGDDPEKEAEKKENRRTVTKGKSTQSEVDEF